MVCDLQTACFLLFCICGLTSCGDPLKIEISGGHFSVLIPPVSVEPYWQFWGLLEYLLLFFSPSHYHPAIWLLCLPLPLGVLVLPCSPWPLVIACPPSSVLGMLVFVRLPHWFKKGKTEGPRSGPGLKRAFHLTESRGKNRLGEGGGIWKHKGRLGEG